MKVFKGNYADAYDHIYKDKNYLMETELVIQALSHSKIPVTNILDIGCGTGGHALELVKSGFKVTGVDPSSSMLEIASKKFKTPDLLNNIKFINSKAEDFVLNDKHDAAIMMFAVLGYHKNNQNILNCLSNISQHLKKDGILIFDFWYGPAVLHQRPSDRIKIVSDDSSELIRMTQTNLDSFNNIANVNFETMRIEESKIVSRSNETHGMRYFFPQEIDLFLDLSGFSIISLTAFPSIEERLSDNSWNALCVAQKN